MTLVWPRTRPRIPFGVQQLILLGLLYVGYTGSRTLANDDPTQARRRATELLTSERWLHIDVESRLNHWVSGDLAVAIAMSYWYSVLHYVVTPAVLVSLYRRDRHQFGRARNALIIATLTGLIGFLVFPTAPPRLMHGAYVDTLAQVSQYGWWSSHASAPAGLGGLTNELAAMPSLHVGWAVWVAWTVWTTGKLSYRFVGVSYAIGTDLVVLGTGNHWILDVLAGTGTAAVGILMTSPSRSQFGFSAIASTLRIDRPEDVTRSSARGPLTSDEMDVAPAEELRGCSRNHRAPPFAVVGDTSSGRRTPTGSACAVEEKT